MVGFLWLSLLLPGAELLDEQPENVFDWLTIMVTMAAFVTLPMVGAILVTLRPSNVVGWLLLVSGVGLIYTFFAPSYVERSLVVDPLPGYELLDWLYPVEQGITLFLLAFWLPLLFPEGKLLSRRWRLVAYPAAIATAASAVLGFLEQGVTDFGRQLPNPLRLSEDAAQVVTTVGELVNVVLLVAILLGMLSVLLRFRRSRGPERQQMKWFLAGAGLVFAATILTAVSFVFSEDFVTFAYYGLIAAVAFLPIAIGIAVLRYRLYEIDRLISRTIGWALVTGLLVGAFALLVLGSSAVLEPLTGGNTLAVAGSTLVVALLFNPLRTRVQGAVDRRFDRSRYDGERTLVAFGDRLRDEVDLETIRADMLATVESSVRPSRVGLWLRTPGGER